MDLSSWKGVPRPERITLEGRFARLEPLDPGRHGDDLFAASMAPGAEDRFRYLPDNLPADRAAFSAWLETSASGSDPLFFATIYRRTNRVEGRQALMRIDPAHGVVEVGHILWGPAITRSRVTTEVIYLLASYVFDTLGYRRLEWKLNSRNEPSWRAAARFGFAHEGVFRQHMVIKGENRDTAWFAMLDADWPRLKPGYERWLHPDNFDADGTQKTKLTFDSV